MYSVFLLYTLPSFSAPEVGKRHRVGVDFDFIGQVLSQAQACKIDQRSKAKKIPVELQKGRSLALSSLVSTMTSAIKTGAS